MYEKFLHQKLYTNSYFLVTNCQWGNWTLGECSRRCGKGTRTNTRKRIVEEANGGTCAGESSMTENCNIQECTGM